MNNNMKSAIECGLCDISNDALLQAYVSASMGTLNNVIGYFREMGEVESDLESNLELAETAYGILEKVLKNMSIKNGDLEIYVERVEKLYTELEGRKL